MLTLKIQECFVGTILATLLCFLVANSRGDMLLREIKAQRMDLHEGIVNHSREVLYNFDFTGLPFYETMKVKVWTSVAQESKSLSKEFPVMFTVRQRDAVTSWQLPDVVLGEAQANGSTRFFEMDKVLCFDLGLTEEIDEKNIQVVVFTQCKENLKFQLRVVTTNDYVVQPNASIRTNFSFLSSDFYLFKFANLEDTALIKISSTDSNCIIVSVQPPWCPVRLSESDVQSHGRWMTVTSTAGLVVNKKDFPTGFYLVFVGLMTNFRCEQYQGIVPPQEFPFDTDGSTLRFKAVNFEITATTANPLTPALAFMLPLLIYCPVIVLILIMFSFFHKIKHGIVASNDGESNPDMPLLRSNTGSLFQKFKDKLKSPVSISELIKMDITRLEKKSKRFYWAIIVVSIFYFLPVCQLALLYLKVTYRTGDEDICYYNFLCAHQYGFFKDFNHIYSNIGYVFFGVIFIVLVRVKHSRLKNLEKDCDTNERYSDELEMDELESNVYLNRGSTTDTVSERTTSSFWLKVFPEVVKSRDCGVFYHFGLFYAMGIALILEGFLSGAYHICPTQTNFQFDSSFMYVLVILIVVKLYQFRHPIYVNANVTFVSLALITIWAYLGLEFNNSNGFKAAFTVFHFTCIFNLLLYQYYVGYLRIDNEVTTSVVQLYRYVFSKLRHLLLHRDLKTFRRQTLRPEPAGAMVLQTHDYTPNRALLPSLAIIFNVLATVMYFTRLSDTDFASQVLGILIINSVVYFAYYVLMKFIHNEYNNGMWLQTLIYSAMALCFWIPSFMYFSRALTSWSGAPAESRARNQECFVLDFYDYHDIWHFLSAVAMFCSFLVLLTIDDDLIATSKSQISVF